MQFSVNTVRTSTGNVKAISVSGRRLRVSTLRSPLKSGCRSAQLFCEASKTDGSVIEKTSPSHQKGTLSLTKRPPIYKVMLHNDNYNKREYVVRVLVKVVDNFCITDAVNVMQEAHETGVAMVTACSQEEAERYCESLRGNGLSCTIEPGC